MLLDLATPAFAAAGSSATRETKLAGAAVPNFFRKPSVPAVLVGDAGYSRTSSPPREFPTPSTTRNCAPRLSPRRSRRAHSTMRWTSTSGPGRQRVCRCTNSRPTWPRSSRPRPRRRGCSSPPRGQEAMDGFARMNAGTISPAEFFAPANVQRDDEHRRFKPPRSGAAIVELNAVGRGPFLHQDTRRTDRIGTCRCAAGLCCCVNDPATLCDP